MIITLYPFKVFTLIKIEIIFEVIIKYQFIFYYITVAGAYQVK